jgi:carboxylesterase type B
MGILFLFIGAPHGSELLYLFGPTVYRQEIGVGFSRQDEAVSDLMKRAWLEFASLG